MAKRINTPTTPRITHTETICYAIRAIEAEIADWHTRCQGREDFEQMMEQATAHLKLKLEALQEMYRLETGHEYC